MAEKKNDFLTYKGKPLVRNGNTIYYGDMNDDFVIMMRILSSKEFGDTDLASKVSVQLVNTDPNVSIKEKIVKTSEKKDVLANKILTADVFEQTKTNGLKELWNEAQDIEITLDFITYGSNLIKKLLSKVLPKI